jgi:hypothetical protein
MKMSHLSALVAIACGGCLCPSALSAQSVALTNVPLVSTSMMASGNVAGASHDVTVSSSSSDTVNAVPPAVLGLVVAAALPKDPATVTKPLTARWLDLTTFSHTQRYRNQYGDDGFHYFENGQERSLLAGRIKLDKEGKYAIGFRASTGRSFNWSFADYVGGSISERLSCPAASLRIKVLVHRRKPKRTSMTREAWPLSTTSILAGGSFSSESLTSARPPFSG